MGDALPELNMIVRALGNGHLMWPFKGEQCLEEQPALSLIFYEAKGV